jgi:hypothetical protein
MVKSVASGFCKQKKYTMGVQSILKLFVAGVSSYADKPEKAAESIEQLLVHSMFFTSVLFGIPKHPKRFKSVLEFF